MSLRAYKITKIEWEKDSTFNINHDDFLNDYLNPEYSDTMFEVSRDNVMTALFNIKSAPKEKQKYYKEILENLFNEMDKQDTDYLSFYVF